MGKVGKMRARIKLPTTASPSPSAAPTSDSMADSERNSFWILWPGAPTALSSPISAVRWDTAISITFMIRIPATARLMAAMPPTAMVRTLKMRSKVASKASWVITVISSSPS